MRQLDHAHLHWVAEFGGPRHEWYAKITEPNADEPVAWRNTGGTDNAGVVTFHRRRAGCVRPAPEGDLGYFKELVESRCAEMGGWRGEVKRPDEV